MGVRLGGTWRTLSGRAACGAPAKSDRVQLGANSDRKALENSSVSENAGEGQQSERARVASDILEMQIKISGALYDKAAAYTNLIIIGGYAGYFGLWQLTKDHLSKQQSLWSALLVLASLFVFIVFEVIKMVITSRAMVAHAKVLRSPAVRDDPDELLKQLKRSQLITDREAAGLVRLWYPSIIFCLVAALVGAGVLAYAFVRGLLS